MFHRLKNTRDLIRAILLLGFYLQGPASICSASSKEVEALAKLTNLIDEMQENSNYFTSIQFCQRLIQQADQLPKEKGFDFKTKGQMYLIEAYRELNMFPQFEKAVIDLEHLLKQRPPSQIWNLSHLIDEYAMMIYLTDAWKLSNNKKAQEKVNSAIQFVLDHPEFYCLDYNNLELDNKFYRLFQCYIRLGRLAMADHNFAKAKIAFIESLNQARLADRAIGKSRLAEQGCEETALIELIALGLESKDNRMTDYYLDSYQKINKSTAYSKNRNRDLLIILLQKEDLTRDQGIQLIRSMYRNPLASIDPLVQQTIIDFYLKNNMFEPCRQLIKQLGLISYHSNQISSWYLAKAGLAHGESDYSNMSAFIDSSLYFLRKGRIRDTIWQDQGLRSQLFETIQRGLRYFNEGYEITGENDLQIKKIHLIGEFITGLQTIRNDKISDQDRLQMVQELNPVLDIALKSYSDQMITSSPDYDLVLSCFEAGKAFNLLTEYTLKKNLKEHEFKTYTKLLEEQKRINRQYGIQGVSLEVLHKQEGNVQNQLLILLAHHQNDHQPQRKITEIQNQLDESTSILEFFKGRENIYALVINRNEVKLFSTPVIDSAINQDIKNLQLSLWMKEGSAFNSMRDSLFTPAASNLYQILIAPIESYLKNRLVIIPDLSLAQVPFACLLTKPISNARYKTWPFWLHHHIISVQYSIALWLDARSGKSDDVMDHDLIAFAPLFEDLKHNQEEVKSLTKIIRSSEVFIGKEATQMNFRKNAHNTRIIHIASHAKSNPESQDDSYIKMYQDTLYAGDIGLMNLPQDMVFLSACETGVGRIVSGEGMMSLARSFFQAGAKSVISTLWPIEDQISKGQVLQIYQYFKKGKYKDEAIRDMQIKYLTHARQDLAFPAFWAAYICQGDYGVLYTGSFQNTFLILGLISLLTIIAGSLMYIRYRKKLN